MNAYDILNINELLEKSEGEIVSDQDIDERIQNRAKIKIDEEMAKIKSTLESSTDKPANLDKVIEEINELVKLLLAYDLVATTKSRKEYDEKGKTDIDKHFLEMNELLNSGIELKTQGGYLNAYQMLGVANDGRTMEHEQQDEHIRRRTLSAIRTIVSMSKSDSIEDIEDIVFNLTKYIWAYSNIKTNEKRVDYKYRSIVQKGDKTSKGLGNIEMSKLPKEQTYSFRPTAESKYARIDLSKVAILEAKAFVAYEELAKCYKVVRHRKDGHVIKCAVSTNIDMDRIREDREYREKVEKNLLSDEAIKIGQKYFGGYIGELDTNGDIKYDLECIGAMRKWIYDKVKVKEDKEDLDNSEKQEDAIKDTDFEIQDITEEDR